VFGFFSHRHGDAGTISIVDIAVAIEQHTLARRVLALLDRADLQQATCRIWEEDGSASAPDVAILAAIAGGRPDPRALVGESERLAAGALVVVIRPGATVPVRRLLAGGVRALVELDRLDDTLVLAVQAACSGQILLPQSVGWNLTRPALSTREKQILGMVILGLSNREIADQLFVAESTVKTHLVSVFRKLDVRSRREAVALILDPQQGLGTGILAISNS
jgi:DNA-binding NarL/FixJ family response regulator